MASVINLDKLQIDPVGTVLDMAQAHERLIAVTCFANMYSIIRKLLTFAPGQHERVLLGIPISRPHDVSIIVKGGTVVKSIPDCDTFFSRFGTSFSQVKVRHLYEWPCAYLVLT